MVNDEKKNKQKKIKNKARKRKRIKNWISFAMQFIHENNSTI
jgi:hypothetical protein